MAADCKYLIATIDRQLFAIAARDIREMVSMPEVARVPDAPAYIRGVCSLHGRVLPIIDTRIRMGRRSARQELDEFCALMQQREQDHVRWLKELEASAREGREFKLTLDPHQCAFGKWYDAYQSEDALISGLLKKFDEPHKRIHATGAAVQRHLANNDRDAAHSLIELERETTFSEVKNLFASLRVLVYEQQREMAIVLTAREKVFGAAVDMVVSVESFRSSHIGPLPPGLQHGGMVSDVARRDKTDELVLMLDLERLSHGADFDQVCGQQRVD